MFLKNQQYYVIYRLDFSFDSEWQNIKDKRFKFLFSPQADQRPEY